MLQYKKNTKLKPTLEFELTELTNELQTVDINLDEMEDDEGLLSVLQLPSI